MAERFVDVSFNLPVHGTFTYTVPDGMPCVVGVRVTAPVGRRVLTGAVVAERDSPPEGVTGFKEIRRVVDREPLFGPEQVELSRWISSMYLCSLGEALSVMLPGGRQERGLPGLDIPGDPVLSGGVTLSTEQEAAIARICGARSGIFYLYGITGSGKTEVFLRAAALTLEEGRDVIYLVPEISLTHQVVEAVRARFREQVAVLHSGLTPSQRLTEWMRIRKGEARLVIGARSAVFSPVRNLGMVVVDEEHEGSYKSGSTPRYHARQVAMKRCRDAGARLVMGSATPSAEAFHLMREGRLDRIRLTRRLSGGSMPEIVVVDMKKEQGAISKRLSEEIRRTREEGRQSILFLNRRGFSYFFHCRSCGYQMKCRNCSVSLTYHKSRNQMLCHYCGFRSFPVSVCPECGSLDVGYSGFGTEKIEEDLARHFPDFSIRRVDTDAVRKRDVLPEILSDFRSGKIDILVGTQMVAKGLNFPGVKLVGIVLADTGLQVPDFRSEERTFALVTQVSGRAGRFFPDGRVIVQTFLPQNEAIRLAAAGDEDSFYRKELESRRMLWFPPYSRLIRIVFRSRDRDRAQNTALAFAEGVMAAGRTGAEILGPAECPLAVISRNFRFQLIFRSASFDVLHAAVSRIYRSFSAPRDVYLEVDVDPVSLL